MLQSTIEHIEALASDIVISAYGDISNVSLPVDLNKILDDYGITLKSGNFDDAEIAGAYDKIKREIYIASDDARPRQSFTIAHELGHFFLHKDKKKEVFHRIQAVTLNGAGELKFEEQEANWFAASILMPRELIVNFYFLLRDITQLALLFGVSQTAVYWRLKNLGLEE